MGPSGDMQIGIGNKRRRLGLEQTTRYRFVPANREACWYTCAGLGIPSR